MPPDRAVRQDRLQDQTQPEDNRFPYSAIEQHKCLLQPTACPPATEVLGAPQRGSAAFVEVTESQARTSVRRSPLFDRARIYGIADSLRWALIGLYCDAVKPGTPEYSTFSDWQFLRARAGLRDPHFDDRVRNRVKSATTPTRCAEA